MNTDFKFYFIFIYLLTIQNTLTICILLYISNENCLYSEYIRLIFHNRQLYTKRTKHKKKGTKKNVRTSVPRD